VCRAFAAPTSPKGQAAVRKQEATLRPTLAGLSDAPEVFDRLYETGRPFDGFQRTRGVLKLMAKVISAVRHNKDLMILSGSLRCTTAARATD